MTHSRRINLLYLITLAFLIALSFWACKEDEIGPTSDCYLEFTPHPSSGIYDGIIDKYKEQGLPGIALLINNDEGLFAGAAGFADIENGIPMEACHVSKMASVTKMYIATLVMKLVEDGVFTLEDPISMWLPSEVIEKVANADQVNIGQLLNHTAGMYDVIKDDGFYLAVLNDPAKFWTPDDLLKYVYGKDPLYAVGSDGLYSNTHYLLIAMIIEEATGRSHAELLRERILAPLSATNTFYHWHESLPDNVAQGYYDLHNNGTIVNMSNFNTGSGNGYGGMYSNVFDMQIFVEALLKEQTILQPSTLDDMMTFDNTFGEDTDFGMGLMWDFKKRAPDEYAIGHRGRDLAYGSDCFYFPEKNITMVFLINYGTDGDTALKEVFNDFREELVNALLSE